MALFLVQHGISAAKDIDPDKGLTSQGIKETGKIAQVAKGYNIRVGKIVHSGKKRAEQTAKIYHETLSVKIPLQMVAGINPMDDVRAFAATIAPASDLLVVGHLPFMQRLLSYLTAGSEKLKIYQFQNSGIVCLDTSEGANGTFEWFIKWTINPHIS